MPPNSPLTLDDLRIFEAQVNQHPAEGGQTVPFLKDGMLAVIRTAIAAMEELERVTPSLGR